MNKTKSPNPQDLMTEDEAADHMINRAELMANDIPGAEGVCVLDVMVDRVRNMKSRATTHTIESAGKLACFREINGSEIQVTVLQLRFDGNLRTLSSRIFDKDMARAIWKTMSDLTAATITKNLNIGIFI